MSAGMPTDSASPAGDATQRLQEFATVIAERRRQIEAGGQVSIDDLSPLLDAILAELPAAGRAQTNALLILASELDQMVSMLAVEVARSRDEMGQIDQQARARAAYSAYAGKGRG